jgi:hypothetical protein
MGQATEFIYGRTLIRIKPQIIQINLSILSYTYLCELQCWRTITLHSLTSEYSSNLLPALASTFTFGPWPYFTVTILWSRATSSTVEISLNSRTINEIGSYRTENTASSPRQDKGKEEDGCIKTFFLLEASVTVFYLSFVNRKRTPSGRKQF